MNTKLIEVRDRGTRVHVLAIRFSAENEAENFILSSAGYGMNNNDYREYIIMLDINTPIRVWFNSFDCEVANKYARTFPEAHKELETNWDKYQSGDVLDVQFVLKETDQPKQSDRYESSR